MQKQQDTGCVRGTGDVLVLYGLNVVLACADGSSVATVVHCRVCAFMFAHVCVSVRKCPFHCEVPWHSWLFSPVSANYWREHFGELPVSRKWGIIHSEDLLYGICCRSVGV